MKTWSRWWQVSHAGHKLRWCLKKAEKEGTKHRGLVRIEPDLILARKHILKAEHNLKAITRFKEIGFSDWSASATFYAIYHALLAILAKHGYESRNQECTFAVIYHLIETGRINLDRKIIEEIHELQPEEQHQDPTIVDVRETEQYGVSLSLEEDTFKRLLTTAKTVLDQVKVIIEQ
jgi:uncharacterized protein (UPF0332 family)